MAKRDFIVIGSGGGGATIAWLLAKRGYSVLLLEQGGDPLATLNPATAFDPQFHDEYRWRLRRPSPTRRPAWDYNTFWDPTGPPAALPGPIKNPMGGWTNSVLGGGSVGWGVWSLRALPVDFALRTLFDKTAMGGVLRGLGYAVEDWPLRYSDLAPCYDVAETIFAVSGDRAAFKQSAVQSEWYQSMGLSADPEFQAWENARPFPLPAYPTTPVGAVVAQGLKVPCPLPVAIVNPGTHPYHTREVLWDAWSRVAWPNPATMPKSAEELWSNRVREACNLCGYCGEYVCWGGHSGPKSGTRVTVIEELRAGGLPNAEVRVNTKVFQIVANIARREASAVRYLDVSDRDHPAAYEESAARIIVSCGAVQTARLLLLSGLGGSVNAIGRHAMFHMFGLQSSATFDPRFAGLLRQELGPTGNTASMSHYFVQGTVGGTSGWLKGGILASSASKNPLEGAWGKAYPSTGAPVRGAALLDASTTNTLTVNLRMTGDDLPHPDNRVVLDPTYVDEFGFPVARIQRSKRDVETAVESAVTPVLRATFNPVAPFAKVKTSPMDLQLVGDHQLGTCRMGSDPTTSVVDGNCQMHALKNVYLVDTSVFTTGFGVNPMMTVVANALRVGSRL